VVASSVSWGKTPFTCNLLRLNAFYMQIHPGSWSAGQDAKILNTKFLFMIFNEPSFWVCSMIDAILGMLQMPRICPSV